MEPHFSCIPVDNVLTCANLIFSGINTTKATIDPVEVLFDTVPGGLTGLEIGQIGVTIKGPIVSIKVFEGRFRQICDI